jgi:hypothetical protein
MKIFGFFFSFEKTAIYEEYTALYEELRPSKKRRYVNSALFETALCEEWFTTKTCEMGEKLFQSPLFLILGLSKTEKIAYRPQIRVVINS